MSGFINLHTEDILFNFIIHVRIGKCTSVYMIKGKAAIARHHEWHIRGAVICIKVLKISTNHIFNIVRIGKPNVMCPRALLNGLLFF